MSAELEALIDSAVDTLRSEGFDDEYIAVAVASYRQNLQEQREKARDGGVQLATSAPHKVTSVSSVDDPYPKESIGWESRVLRPGESPPGGWIIADV